MGKELAFTTSAFISTDNLETFYAKKSDVICFWFPLRCDIYMQILTSSFIKVNQIML